MIWESSYWKEDLLETADYLESWLERTDWSEEQLVDFEKAVFMSAYSVRKLSDSYKLSEETKSDTIQAIKYPCQAERVNLMNSWEYWDLYDLENGTPISLSIRKLCNQLIHSFVFLAESEGPEDEILSTILFNSDYTKEDLLYRVKIADYVGVLKEVGNDYPSRGRFYYDSDEDEYIFEAKQ
ncbi:hypothetical protein [Salinibacter ruber]|uniref:hypothetical protein n=1 Tax=Salinibacter ruber TaxID=146919 RepID=UPI002169B4F7|nr:hypothetical protein [Salinibacter ruber]MCS3702589.1 hypothetical protein [Salinibacter ruber]